MDTCFYLLTLDVGAGTQSPVWSLRGVQGCLPAAGAPPPRAEPAGPPLRRAPPLAYPSIGGARLPVACGRLRGR